MVIFLKSYFFTPSPPLLKDLENYNMNLGYQSILQHKTIHFFRFRSCRQTHNSAAFRNGPSGTSNFGKVFSFFSFFFNIRCHKIDNFFLIQIDMFEARLFKEYQRNQRRKLRMEKFRNSIFQNDLVTKSLLMLRTKK